MRVTWSQLANMGDDDVRLMAHRALDEVTRRWNPNGTTIMGGRAGAMIQSDPPSRESQVAHWIRGAIGEDSLQRKERALRLLEEAAELAQAEGVDVTQAQRQIDHVFRRPAGQPHQEAGGVAVCLLGWCYSAGLSFEVVADAEIRRIYEKPLEEIRGSLARKADADLVTTVKREEPE